MNFGQDHDGERHEPLRLSPVEKADGFAAVMGRLKGRTVQEQARLRAQADAAVLGHEAYALGHDYRRRGNYVAAKRWLRVAADHSVPGAEEALEEIDAVTPAAPATAADPAGSAPGTVIPSSSLAHEPFGTWATVVDSLDVAACAQAQARRITEQARRTAEGLLAETRRTIRRERAQAMGRLEKARRTVAKLLCEAEQVQQETWGIREEARRQAEALLEEARDQAQQIVDEARVQADQTRTATQQHSIGMPSEALPATAADQDAVSAAYQRLYTNFETAHKVALARFDSEVPSWRLGPLAPTQTLPITGVLSAVRGVCLMQSAVRQFPDAPRTASSSASASSAHPVIGHEPVVQSPFAATWREVARRVRLRLLRCEDEWQGEPGITIHVVSALDFIATDSSVEDILKACSVEDVLEAEGTSRAAEAQPLPETSGQ
ncbi:DivIVA domain-containing protein [Streptomyces sp. NPDC003697]